MTLPRALLRARSLRLELVTPAAVALAQLPSPSRNGQWVKRLLEQDRSVAHWAHDYADRLVRRAAAGAPVLIQTSMSPSGYFHVGNFRDSVTAHLVARAVRQRGHRARVLLSFDDFDPFKANVVADPELAAFAARPMGEAAERSTAICRAYIAELKAVGICPPEADADGRTPPGSDWGTHYQLERYRAGRYLVLQRRFVRARDHLAQLLGSADPDRLFTPYCAQCGRNTTSLAHLSARGVAYRCRGCGARVTTADLRELKPAWAVDWALRVVHEGIDCEPAGHDHCVAGSTMDRTHVVFERMLGRRQPVIVPYALVRQFAEQGKISGSRGGGLRVADLLEVLAPRMVLWLYARVNCRDDLRISLDLGMLARWYHEYDAFCDRARHDRKARALWDLLTDEPPVRAPVRRPGFRRVAGAVQSHLFDLPAAGRALRAKGFGAEPELLRERLVLTCNWLATWGRERCWLPVAPKADAGGWRITDRMLDARGFGRRFEPEEYHGYAMALFGTRTGPPLSRVVERFGTSAVVDALTAFRRDGSRPLRDELERRLASRQAPAWD